MTTDARPDRVAGSPFARLRTSATRVAEVLAAPLLPTDYLDMVAPLRAGAELRARVVAITPETADAATITLRPGRDWAGHRAGQYIRLGIDIDGVRRWRAYSITSPADRTDGLITITVKAMADGLVSRHLVHDARPGTLVMLDQASGDFVLPEVLPERLLFVTGGSGITPVMGMLRSHDLSGTDVVLLHSAPTPADVIFAAELAAERPGVRVVVRHTDDEGMLSPQMLDDVVPDWRERQAWACGPTPMLDAFEEHFAGHGLTEAMHVERFRPVLAVTGDGGSVTMLDAARPTASPTFEVDGATTILDAAEDAGVLMPSGCRMGICMGCVLPLTDGAVRDLRTGIVTETTTDDPPVKVQTCISAAAGACTIQQKERA